MSAAWLDPAAWTGMTSAGGVDLPGEEAMSAALGFLEMTRQGPVPPGLFGDEVTVPHDAPLLDRVLGLAGRDPAWTP